MPILSKSFPQPDFPTYPRKPLIYRELYTNSTELSTVFPVSGGGNTRSGRNFVRRREFSVENFCPGRGEKSGKISDIFLKKPLTNGFSRGIMPE